ncbi:hypothetical protein [Roseibium salinum]|uniref:Protease inhibitor Inh n=1 Tax=Roseibium salinum TaxID=1604349 RepID=A0ABT3R5J7_9HYPH|nr:hypothetical protein [Roseibium sp. DSM 29163]MCX2724566.1 hypothetical protein [Roseibium sp. DSM 29163]
MLAALLAAAGGSASAGKGDLKANVPRSAPLLEGKALDLRFAKFAQGIWVSDLDHCPGPRIDQSPSGTTVAIYRGLLETPDKICQVYGAEKDAGRTQRAAINCLLDSGNEAIELVTVRPRGTNVLMVQEGEKPPAEFRFCKQITPILQSAVGK